MRTIQTVFIASLVGCASQPSGPEWGDVHYIVWGSSGSTVTVAWAPTEGAVTYTIERGSSEADLAPIATVPASARSFLDTGLQPLTEYTYRFTITTAGGAVVEPAQDARTTDDEILVTGEPAPLGAPVVATVGAAGAAIDVAGAGATVVVPPDAVPEGTVVTIQPIASPYADDDSPGVTIESTVPFSKPVDLVFGFDEVDALAPESFSIAVQAEDGSWIAQPRVIDADARTITLTLPVEAARFAATWAVPIKYHAAVRLRAAFVFPRKADVDINKTVNLRAVGLFSDDPCDDPADTAGCVAMTAAGLGLGLIDPRDAFRPARQYMKPLSNSKDGYERTWTVELAINGNASVGTIATPSSTGAIYTAPAAKPASNPVAVRFTSVEVSTRRAVTPMPAIINIKDPGSLRVTADLRWDGLFCAPAAINLTDHFTLALTHNETGYQVEAISNTPTNLTPPLPPPGDTVEVTVEPEAFTVTGGSVEEDTVNNQLYVTLNGTIVEGTCVIHHQSGAPDIYHGSPTGTVLFFVVELPSLHTPQNDPWWTFTAEHVGP